MADEVILLGDCHFGVRNDNIILRNQMVSYFKDQLFPYILDNGIQVVFQLGDLFDKRKSTNNETMYIVRTEILDWFEANKIYFIVLTGNHDIYYRDDNTISTVVELLRGYEYVKAFNEPASININNVNIDLIPWINKNNGIQVNTFVANSTSDFCLGHFEFSGFRFSKDGQLSEHGMSITPFKKYKMVYSGHYHTRSKINNVEYIGTPYELTKSDYDDPKGITVLNVVDGTTKFIENSFKLHKKIVYNDKVNDYSKIKAVDFKDFRDCILEVHVNVKEKKKTFDKLINFIYSNNPSDVDIIDNTNKITYDEDITVNASVETGKLLDNGVKNIASNNSNICETKLKQITDDVYNKALNLKGK